MENTEQKYDTLGILKKLMLCPYSQTESIDEAEQNLRVLQQQSENINVLIGMLFCRIMSGNRKDALDLTQKIWRAGGNLTPFFELLYTDCLLNLGETESAKILIDPRLKKMPETVNYFYMVFVKYALISGNLTLLDQIGDYQDNRKKEKVLFDFAKKHAYNESSQHFKILITTITDIVKDYLCSFEYVMYPDTLELVLYTTATPEENDTLQQQMELALEEKFAEATLDFDDFSITLEPISSHAPWLEP
ncbi:MAG: hypothetical protein MJ210_02050 [Alphaproteobacteria bacterium]|nr:hypothetical protein [Alphaproteobacteria bacterium]